MYWQEDSTNYQNEISKTGQRIDIYNAHLHLGRQKVKSLSKCTPCTNNQGTLDKLHLG